MSDTTDTTDGAEARIRQLVQQIKTLQARVTELEPVATEAASYRAQLEEMKGITAAEREALRLEREIYAAGVTDAEGIEYVQHAYGKLKAEDRPALGDWLQARDSLPRAVRAYLPEATVTAAAPAPVVADLRRPMPASSSTVVPAANAGANAFSAERIMSMSRDEFRANLAAITAARGTP